MIPVTLPPYYQADQHVVVQEMRNYSIAGKAIQTLLTKQHHQKWIIYFKTNIFTLNESQKQLLQTLNHRHRYVIAGFASMMGSSIINDHISKERADAVYHYLSEREIKTCRIENSVLSVNPPYRAQRVEVSIGRC